MGRWGAGVWGKKDRSKELTKCLGKGGVVLYLLGREFAEGAFMSTLQCLASFSSSYMFPRVLNVALGDRLLVGPNGVRRWWFSRRRWGRLARARLEDSKGELQGTRLLFHC